MITYYDMSVTNIPKLSTTGRFDFTDNTFLSNENYSVIDVSSHRIEIILYNRNQRQKPMNPEIKYNSKSSPADLNIN